MLAGQAISMMDALGISIACMLVVFAVLLILFVCVSLFPKAFRQKAAAPAAAQAPAAAPAVQEEDDGELPAVIAAAIQCYEQEKKKPSGRRMARNFKG